jgi:hypothetical protein
MPIAGNGVIRHIPLLILIHHLNTISATSCKLYQNHENKRANTYKRQPAITAKLEKDLTFHSSNKNAATHMVRLRRFFRNFVVIDQPVFLALLCKRRLAPVSNRPDAINISTPGSGTPAISGSVRELPKQSAYQDR